MASRILLFYLLAVVAAFRQIGCTTRGVAASFLRPSIQSMPLGSGFASPIPRVSIIERREASQTLVIHRVRQSPAQMLSSTALPVRSRRQTTAVYTLILTNLFIFLADRILHVNFVHGLYLHHSCWRWWQPLSSSFCHVSRAHLSGNLLLLLLFGRSVEDEVRGHNSNACLQAAACERPFLIYLILRPVVAARLVRAASQLCFLWCIGKLCISYPAPCLLGQYWCIGGSLWPLRGIHLFSSPLARLGLEIFFGSGCLGRVCSWSSNLRDTDGCHWRYCGNQPRRPLVGGCGRGDLSHAPACGHAQHGDRSSFRFR